MSAHDRELVATVIADALHAEFHMNADPYEDDPYRFGVSFPDGSMIDVHIGEVS